MRLPRPGLVVVLLVLAATALLAWSSTTAPTSLWRLPYLASRSVARMAAAFALSTAFAIVYGQTCATSNGAARVMIPVLDVLQSVPILGFFPAAVLLFVSLFNGSIWGLELASVFLIFTSQSWNMAFGVYEAMSTIPKETLEAADVVGARGWMRFRRVLLPAAVPKLVYNGILSWAAGWYFVTAAEILSANGQDAVLPGLGSFLFHASERGDLRALAAGLFVLVCAVLVFELLVWRPLQVWSDRFKFESVRAAAPPQSRLLSFYRRLRPATPHLPRRQTPRIIPRPRRDHGVAWRRVRIAVSLFFAAMFLFAVSFLAYRLAEVFSRPIPSLATSIPLALAASTMRLLVAYAITVAWTVPAAIAIARNDRLSRLAMPFAETMASLPAVALFPVIILLVAGPTGSIELPSILLVLTGMQWYLLFNLIAGARAVPNDLLAAAEVQGVKGWLLWKRVLLPAMVPAFLTGSITAWGGGWNALIVSEYVRFSGHTYHAFGIGDLIARASESKDGSLLLLSVLAMVGLIIALNGVVWKRLYRKAMVKYRLEA